MDLARAEGDLFSSLARCWVLLVEAWRGSQGDSVLNLGSLDAGEGDGVGGDSGEWWRAVAAYTVVLMGVTSEGWMDG